MILGTACLGESALDGGAIRKALAALDLDDVLLVPNEVDDPRELHGLPIRGVRVSWHEVAAGLKLARSLGSARLVLEPDLSLDLEATCRQLFDLTRRNPGLSLALLTPSEGTLATPQALGLVLDDLASVRLAYWHRPSRVHRLGQRDADWLESLGRHLVGMSLDDVVSGEAGLPPGAGEVDWASLAELSGRSLEVALDVDPLPDVALLRSGLARLREEGFR